MYFSRGNLPWQERYLGGPKGGTKEDKYRRILDKKDCPSTCAMSIHQTNLQQTKEKDTIFNLYFFHLTTTIGYNAFAKWPTLIALNDTSKEESC